MRQALTLSDTKFYQYHQLSKHTLDKLTSSHYQLDWDNQPNPFRKYEGAARIELPHPSFVSAITYFQALEAMLSGQGIAGEGGLPEPHHADLSFVSHLLFYSMSISAWKQLAGTQHRWSLRVNPSSGDLHPTDTHLIVRKLSGLPGGAYHYFVPRHELELRSGDEIADCLWSQLGRGGQCPELIVCLTSIFWREAWKYRDRAYRYCQHDLGHALSSILLSAGILGWRAETFGEFPDRELNLALGLAESDERASLLIALWPGLSASASQAQNAEGIWHAADFKYQGTPNRLSKELVPYNSIDGVYKATCLTTSDWLVGLNRTLPASGGRLPEILGCGPELEAIYEPAGGADLVHQVIRKRRSAVDMDGRQRMSKEHLTTICVSATRGFNADFQRPTGWSANQLESNRGHHMIHLYLYVHRVDAVEPGIYYFDRMQQSLVPLAYADQREAAKFFSCFQDIAADGCFALSMIADLNLAYRLYGDRCYRYVHYEAGYIGQWLYLSAQALGYESTGIGCFIDDLINRHLDLPSGFEVIYNFTVGRAVLDRRLTTLPSYDFPDPSLG